MSFIDNYIIEDLIYIPTGDYVPMYNRPYTVNASYDSIEKLTSRIEENKAIKVAPSHIAGIANGLIQNSATPLTTNIDNNWVSIRKYIFLLKVSFVEVSGLKHITYIQGYTEYDGISTSGYADPNLVHIINNVIETYVTEHNTPLGIIRKEKLARIYNVTFNGTDNLIFSQRPKDIFENQTTMNLATMPTEQMYASNNLYSYSPFDSRPVTSTVENCIPTEYFTRILNAGLNINREKSIFLNSLTVDQDYGPEIKLFEPSISDNNFLKLISRTAGYKGVLNKFIFSTLAAVDNTIVNRFKVFNITKNYVDPQLSSTPAVGDFWHGQDPVTLKAYTLIESSVSMAVKYGFSKLYFTASNVNTPTYAPNIFISNFNSFLDLQEQEFNILLDIFKDSYISEILLNESQCNAIPIHIEMYVDLLGTSKIYLHYAGYPANWYTIPTFANSSYMPVMTVDKNTFDITTVNISNIIDNILASNNSSSAFS